MRRQVLIYILILTGTLVKGQPKESQCYFSEKRGLIFSHRALLINLDSMKYLMEYYTYGGGLFSGAPSADTLLLDNGVLRAKKYDLIIEHDRMIIKSKEGRRKFRYQVLNKCDSMINRTRNWPVRETIRYKIKDQSKSEEFWRQTEPMLKLFCYPDFVDKMKEMQKTYGLNK